MWSWICEMESRFEAWGHDHPVLFILLFIAEICLIILMIKHEIWRHKRLEAMAEYDGEEWFDSYVETMTRLGLYNPDNTEDESKC